MVYNNIVSNVGMQYKIDFVAQGSLYEIAKAIIRYSG